MDNEKITSNSVRLALKYANKTQAELAAALGVTPQAIRNKLQRDSFSAKDLISICGFLGFSLWLEKDGVKINLADTRTKEE